MSDPAVQIAAPPPLPAAIDHNDETLRQSDAEKDRAREQSQPSELAPASVPGYAIQGCLGEGAYGSVWLAEEQNTGKQVAIKFYSHRRGLDWSLLNREVEKLAVLYTSRNIVRLIDVGWDSDPPYYVMEYLKNGSLADYLQDGPLPVAEAVRVIKSVLLALVHAHGSGILHCDLKPANVLLDGDFEPRLCDFGQSRLPYEQNPALGTLFYMAPEQAGTSSVPDARWDVYALGALMYHMLSGAPPFRTPENDELVRSAGNLEERLAVYRKILTEGKQPASLRKLKGVDRHLADIIERCLQIDPQKRYPNAQAVLDEFELRDRQRAKRPLLALGIIGPGLLLAATAPFIYQAMSTALATAKGNLTERALESDAHAAKILARSLQRELEDRTNTLTDIAGDENLVRAIETAEAGGWADGDEVKRILERRTRVIDDRRCAQNRELDVSWFFQDAGGIQHWREPHNKKTVGKSWRHRNYFHGLTLPDGRVQWDSPAEVPIDVGPIRRPHICFPFKSKATNRFMVAISVPIYDSSGSRVIGVLARTTHLGQLLADYKRHVSGQIAESEGTRRTDCDQGRRGGAVAAQQAADADRVVALIDARDGKLLDHPWMTPENLQAAGSGKPLAVDETLGLKLRQLLESNRTGHAAQGVDRVANYRDPVGRVAEANRKRAARSSLPPEVREAAVEAAGEFQGDWMAAFSPVGTTGWIAVVQERREEALKPIDGMREGMIANALSAAVVAIGMIVLLLYFVKRGLSDSGLRLEGAMSGTSRNHGADSLSARSERTS